MKIELEVINTEQLHDMLLEFPGVWAKYTGVMTPHGYAYQFKCKDADQLRRFVVNYWGDEYLKTGDQVNAEEAIDQAYSDWEAGKTTSPSPDDIVRVVGEAIGAEVDDELARQLGQKLHVTTEYFNVGTPDIANMLITALKGEA